MKWCKGCFHFPIILLPQIAHWPLPTGKWNVEVELWKVAGVGRTGRTHDETRVTRHETRATTYDLIVLNWP